MGLGYGTTSEHLKSMDCGPLTVPIMGLGYITTLEHMKPMGYGWRNGAENGIGLYQST